MTIPPKASGAIEGRPSRREDDSQNREEDHGKCYQKQRYYQDQVEKAFPAPRVESAWPCLWSYRPSPVKGEGLLFRFIDYHGTDFRRQRSEGQSH